MCLLPMGWFSSSSSSWFFMYFLLLLSVFFGSLSFTCHTHTHACTHARTHARTHNDFTVQTEINEWKRMIELRDCDLNQNSIENRRIRGHPSCKLKHKRKFRFLLGLSWAYHIHIRRTHLIDIHWLPSNIIFILLFEFYHFDINDWLWFLEVAAAVAAAAATVAILYGFFFLQIKNIYFSLHCWLVFFFIPKIICISFTSLFFWSHVCVCAKSAHALPICIVTKYWPYHKVSQSI